MREVLGLLQVMADPEAIARYFLARVPAPALLDVDSYEQAKALMAALPRPCLSFLPSAAALRQLSSMCLPTVTAGIKSSLATDEVATRTVSGEQSIAGQKREPEEQESRQVRAGQRLANLAAFR